MTRVGIAITKSCVFRNSVQEFSNVYFYDGLAGRPTLVEAEALIDELVTKEKTWHAAGVTFVRGRIWEQTGSPGTTEMITQKNLSGTGTPANTANMDAERAFLFRLRAGSDSRGNPVYLRKWYHTLGGFGAVTIAQGVLENKIGFTNAEKDSLRTKLGTIGAIGSGTTAGVLVSKNGRNSTAGAVWEPHTYLEHHQLGDMWRAA
jgi:hypothetical protein